tara:strand:+ start:1039 stop:1836 length:798 start_codon:yes stop_codon:yes gene_type:complete
MAYQKIQVNTGLAQQVFADDVNHIPAAALVQSLTGTSKQVISGVTTSGGTSNLTDTGVDFTASVAPLPVQTTAAGGDKAFNLSTPGNATITDVAADALVLGSAIFNAAGGGESYVVIRPNLLADATYDFKAVGVGEGDLVYNTTASTQALVTGVNGSALTLDTDIFGTSTTFDDNYKIFLGSARGANGSTVMQSADCCLLYVGSDTANASMGDATQYVDIRVLTCANNDVTFKNFKVGEYLPVLVKQLFSTGTSASARNSCLAIW